MAHRACRETLGLNVSRDESQDARRDDGNTPLDEDELEGLIPSHLMTRADLNQWEVTNIERAFMRLAARTPDMLDPANLQELHRRMFDETWEWAGAFRKSDKTISPFHWTEVPRLVDDLVANTRLQCERSSKTPEELDEIAMRFHHALVQIHPWPNGNGRHGRLATDLLLRDLGRPPFSWGGGVDSVPRGDLRGRYISALKAADAGEFDGLARFIRG